MSDLYKPQVTASGLFGSQGELSLGNAIKLWDKVNQVKLFFFNNSITITTEKDDLILDRGWKH